MLAGGLSIYLSYSLILTTSDATAKATIFGAAVTILAGIFTAMYNEIGSYYADRSSNIEKKWELVFPLIKKHYIPWINVAKVMRTTLRNALDHPDASAEVKEYRAKRLLFLILLFYGYRLRFIVEDGGLILLLSPKDEDRVEEDYRNVENAMRWAGDGTALKNSILQDLFLKKEKPNNPYVQARFIAHLQRSAELREMSTTLLEWMTPTHVKDLDQALESFIKDFKSGIDKFYSAWET